MSVNVQLSYEERIINALSRVTHKRADDRLTRDKREFDVMREVLGPLYAEVAQLREDKAKLRTALLAHFHADGCPCDACAYRKFVLASVKA